MKVGHWETCKGCDRRADVCMCRTTLPADIVEVGSSNKRTLAEELRSIAHLVKNKETQVTASNLAHDIMEDARDAAACGKFNIVLFFAQGQYSEAIFLMTAKELEKNGFKCRTGVDDNNHDYDYRYSPKDFIDVSWE